ncbi:MAG: restriction endonuclease [Planctomycetia bacterium]|nr:restriction endonuclease [Planctomycetia bacterium]
MKGSQFLEYIIPLIEVLKENGGSGTTSEIIDAVIDKMNIPDEEVEKTIASGASRIRNRIQWARLYLVKAGLMDSSQRGIWKLTEGGFEKDLNESDVYQLFTKVRDSYISDKKIKKESKSKVDEIDNTIVDDEIHSEYLLNILKKLSPKGFEILCKRLLTEIGIHDVVITGKPSDQGIDGTGIIKFNDVVGFNIIFQFKRYKDSVSPHHVRDFRGTMQGRADKGVIITTGRFTSEAKKEAVRDGVPTIELIDGDKLVSLFEKYELGLKPKTIYDVIPNFFDKYK